MTAPQECDVDSIPPMRTRPIPPDAWWLILALFALVMALTSCGATGVTTSGAVGSGAAATATTAGAAALTTPITAFLFGMFVLIMGLLYSKQAPQLAGGSAPEAHMPFLGWLALALVAYYILTHKHGVAGIVRLVRAGARTVKAKLA